MWRRSAPAGKKCPNSRDADATAVRLFERKRTATNVTYRTDQPKGMRGNNPTRRATLKALAAGIGISSVVGVGTDRASASAFGFTEADDGDVEGNGSFRSATDAAAGTYLVGGGGDLHENRDGSWDRLLDAGPTANSKTLYGVCVSDDGRNVWYCGGNGVVGQYDVLTREFTDHSFPNGVQNMWSDIAVVGDAGEERVTLVNSSAQVVTGTKTDAGGMDWGDTLVPNGGSPVYAVDYYSATGARFADGDGNVYETTDGGESWTQRGVASNGKALYGICCEAADRTVAVGGGGTFAEFDGDGWSVSQVGGTTVYAVDRVGEEGVAAGGSGSAYEYVDGSWEQQGAGGSATLRGAVQSDVSRFGRIRDDATAVDALAGSNNTIYDRGENTARPDRIRVEHVGDAPVSYEFDPGYGVSFVAGTAAEAEDTTEEGVRGSVDASDPVDGYRSSDSFDQFGIREGTIADVAVYVNDEHRSAEVVNGTNWRYVNEDELPTGNTLYSTTDTDDGPYAAGVGGTLVHREPGPEGSWSETLSDGFSGRGQDVTGLATSDDGETLWGAGDSGELGAYHVADETVSDHAKPAGNSSNWADIAVAGPSGGETLFLVNSSGQLLSGQNDDGTLTWGELRKPGAGNPINGITFLDAETGFFCTSGGNAYRTTDGGETWEPFGVENAGVALYDVAATATDDVHVAGSSGYVFRYNGATWTTLKQSDTARRGIARQDDRAAACGKNDIDTRGLDGWNTIDHGLYYPGIVHDVTFTDETSPVGVVVGADGAIYEQQFSGEPYPELR